ncbi:MAG: calcium/sodium antiporter [Gammaproteobacteria bacterium]|jgi:cation:H+ antiporter
MQLGLLTAFILLLAGFFLLAWAANSSVSGAATLAKKFGLSSRLIGLTIIALGTSIPEMVISVIAALHGNPNIAIGNVMGSNIANIGLVLGITALIVPLKVRSTTLRKEFPLLFISMLIVGAFMLSGKLGRGDGILLLIGATLVIFWLIQEGKRRKKFLRKDVLEAEYRKEIEAKVPLKKAILQIAFGLILLPISSNLIVKSSIHIAHHFNISDLIIGLTIVALGTSLPELATSLACARKKEYDIIIGNVIGSNIFNLLAVIGLPAIICQIHVAPHLFIDFAMMFGITVLLFFFAFGHKDKKVLTKTKGSILLAAYITYLIILCI